MAFDFWLLEFWLVMIYHLGVTWRIETIGLEGEGQVFPCRRGTKPTSYPSPLSFSTIISTTKVPMLRPEIHFIVRIVLLPPLIFTPFPSNKYKKDNDKKNTQTLVR